MDNKASEIICPWCNYPAEIVWVHGHGQCSNCGINIDECCRGEQCNQLIKTPDDEEDTN